MRKYRKVHLLIDTHEVESESDLSVSGQVSYDFHKGTDKNYIDDTCSNFECVDFTTDNDQLADKFGEDKIREMLIQECKSELQSKGYTILTDR